ncbi:hypothetical protein PsorP6_017597 [Peronosclerospora sorghi]|uniref:Uncharacterized protein n=1 Tax=Peronosclerospora sorghi TaxID=230839 RepID=A0ACC0WMP8_9STRA|nr:hypothetical protein PsorP6_017597 [Peronosclerospora sorghi]
MKLLLLVVLLLLSSIAAVVQSTPELVQHDLLSPTGLQRHGTHTVRHLETSAFLVPDEWKTAFVQARKDFVDTESQTKAYHYYRTMLPLDLDSTDQYQELMKRFLADHADTIVDGVKIVNAMKMSREPSVRSFAADVEAQLVKKWHTEGKTLKQVFEGLQLNEIHDEMDLYANPAFSTWMAYAKHLYSIWSFSEVGNVLRRMEKSKNFDVIRTMEESGLADAWVFRDIPLRNTLYDKWKFIEEYHHEHASTSN